MRAQLGLAKLKAIISLNRSLVKRNIVVQLKTGIRTTQPISDKSKLWFSSVHGLWATLRAAARFNHTNAINTKYHHILRKKHIG
jgi:hypothetical protein